jgi:hypothetical protein
MFRFNRTIIRPNTRHIIGTLSCIWSDDGSIELKHVAEFLVSITDICCVIDKINYCIIENTTGWLLSKF